MKQLFLSCVLALIATSCGGPRYVDYFPYLDDGTIKPHIALIPIIDSSDANIPWDLSKELTQGLCYRFMHSGDLYLLSRGEMGEAFQESCHADLFGANLTFATKINHADFVVAMELISHEILPSKRGKPSTQNYLCNSALNMKVRLRIVDVRPANPLVVLQEIFTYSHAVHERCDVDDSKFPWGSNGYKQTPYGRAHEQLIRALVNRIENVCWGAR